MQDMTWAIVMMGVGLPVLLAILGTRALQRRAEVAGASQDPEPHTLVDLCRFRVAPDGESIIMQIKADDGVSHYFAWHPNQLYAASTQMGLMYMAWVKAQRGDVPEVAS